jgi:beta-galactosidase
MIKRTPINFDWKYKADFKEDYLKSGFDDKDFETVNIPHSNIEVPENYFDEKIYQFESCYRKELSLAKLDEDERVYIHFEGVMVYARIYLNGQFMGEHKGGYTGFRVDLTEAVIPDSQNDLAVYVDSREREDTPPLWSRRRLPHIRRHLQRGFAGILPQAPPGAGADQTS